MEKPLQEWVSLKNSGIQIASPVALGKEQWRMWNRAKADREEILQLDAFGIDAINPDYFKVREDAAGIYTEDSEGAVLDAAAIMAENGANPEKITSLLETPAPDQMQVESYGLESLAADRQREEALQDNPELIVQDLVNDSEEVADVIAKQDILYTKYKDIEEGVPPLWSLRGLSQAAIDLIPLSDAFLTAAAREGENSGLQGITTGFSWMFSKSAKERAKNALTPGAWRDARDELLFEATQGMTKQQFSAFIDAMEYGMQQRGWSKERQRRVLQSLTFDSAMDRFQFAGDLYPWARGAIKSALNLWQSAKGEGVAGLVRRLRPGNVAKAKEELNRKLNSLSTTMENEGEVADDVLEAVGTVALHPNKAINTMFGELAEKEIESAAANSLALSDKIKVITVDAFTEEEKNLAINVAKNDALKRIKPGKEGVRKDLIEFTNEVNPETGERSVRYVLGHGPQGTARFVSEEAAQNFIKENTNLLKGEADIIRDGSGYLIQVDTTVKDLGKVIERKYSNEWSHWGPLKYVFGRIFQPDEIHDASVVLDTSTRVFKNTVRKDFKKLLKDLKRTELEDLDAVIEQGQAQRLWYSHDWLKNRAGLSDKQIAVYDLYRQYEDLNYSVYNKYIRQQLTNQGYKHVIIGDNHYLGKVETEFESPQKFVFKDLTNGNKIDLGEMSKTEIEKLQNEGKVLIKLRTAVKDVDDDIPYNVIIAARDSAEAFNLPEHVLPYTAGGRKYYPKGTVFMKEVIAGDLNGSTMVYHPRTIGADLDKVAARTKTNEINQAKKLYREYRRNQMSKEAIDALLNEETAGNKYFRVDGLKSFEEMLEENGGFLNWKYDTELLEDGQVMSQIQRMLRSGAVEVEPSAVDAVEDGYDLIRDLTGGLFRHRSGEVLENSVGETAKTLNFLESIDETAKLTSNLMLRKAYDKKYARTIRSLFSDIIDERYLRMQMSDRNFLQNIKLADNINRADPETAKKISNLTYAIQKYNIATHAPTVSDNWWSRTMTSLANAIGETELARDLGVLQRGNWDYKIVSSFNPERFAKVVAYQIFMGFLSPRQYWTQALGAKAIVDLEPTTSARALSVYLPAATAVMTDDPDKLAHLAKKASLLGMDKDTFLDMVEYLKMMGCRAGVESSFTGYAGSTRNQILNLSTSFARKGEEFNDTLAAMVAFLKNKDALAEAGFHHGAKITDKAMKVLRETAGLKDDLYVNMNKVNDTPMSRAPLFSFLTQFQNYGLNSIQILFNKRFTPVQRARMVLSNFLTYGVRGALGEEAGFNVYDYLTEAGVSPGVASGFERGLQGWMFDKLGADADISSAGPGYMNFAQKMMDVFLSGDSTVLDEIPAWKAIKVVGAAPDVISQTGNILLDFLSPERSTQDLYNDLYHLIQLPQPSSLNRAERALLALRTGVMVNTRGDILNLHTKKENAILYGFLGMDTNSQYGTRYMSWKQMKQEDQVKEIMQGLRKDYRDWQMTGSEDAGLRFFTKYATATNGDELDENFKETIKKNVFYMMKYNKPTEIQTRLILKTFAKGRGYKDVQRLLERSDINIQGK